MMSDDNSTCQHAASCDDLPVEALDYDLPAELIARQPAEPRDSARLLVAHRSTGGIEHRTIRDLPSYVKPGDDLILNDTAVIPARIEARRVDTGGRVEGLYLERDDAGQWRAMLTAGGRLREGLSIELLDANGAASGLVLEIIGRQNSGFVLRPTFDEEPLTVLARVGRTPLPPYIRKARGDAPSMEASDRGWYETVYANARHRDSVAAPTAGLHFTDALLDQLRRSGVRLNRVTLQVGPGTFQPITAARLAEHDMHAERVSVPPATIEVVRGRAAEARSGRLIAIGTTTVRALESLPDPLPDPAPPEGFAAQTSLFITPGYRFRFIDGLLTNFHLPRSTLLALVGAMLGLDRLKAIYAEAVRHRYRFYSYGDAMLILP